MMSTMITSFRTDLNNAPKALNTMHSGTSRQNGALSVQCGLILQTR